MTIMREGRDVTEEVHRQVLAKAWFEKHSTDYFAEARGHLAAARATLKGLPAPWMNDCICNSIDAIDKIVADLLREPK